MMQNNSTNYASFGLRFIAAFIDSFIFIIALSPIFMMIFDPIQYTQEEMQVILQTEGLAGLIDPQQAFIQQLVVMVITILFWLKLSGTPGKRMLKLKVVDATTGNPLTLLQSVIRYLGYIIAAFPMGLGFIWIFMDEKNQGWHDKLSNSVVIKEDSNVEKSDNSHKSSVIQKSNKRGSSDNDSFAA